MGNLTEKQAECALVGKFKKTKSRLVLIQKQGGKSEKNKPKMSIFTQKHAQMSFFSKLKEQNVHKI